MRIVFMGTPDFAVESLRSLVEHNYEIAGVITAPDKPSGRGQKLQSSPVKEYALMKGIQVLQPTNLKDPVFIEQLRSLHADLQVVVAFRMLPEIVWAMPPMGTFNLHGSLLPQYRGAAPINWAIINGEKQTGVTTFFLQHEIDTGHIIAKKTLAIEPDDNAGSVHDKLMQLGAALVLETVQQIETGTIHTIPQSSLTRGETLHAAPKIYKETCKIEWNKDTNTIHNLIRGLSPYPAAWTEFRDKTGLVFPVKIFRSEKTESSESPNPGKIKTDGKTYFEVGCSDGYLKILELQVAGKKRMQTEEYLRGNKTEGISIA